MASGKWEDSPEYRKLTAEAAAARVEFSGRERALQDARRTIYMVTQQARQAAREVGCGEYRPGLAHCLMELTRFIERAQELNAGVDNG